ncbi:hypothetical protein VNO77_15627 [Canavalia gladiata]|uniref:Centromere/kinetochore protein zw10 middle domain-containing protein n=1 Tax=Canavalia gladiata TaxID=3824 RepID=A0AAN9QSG2_CANGL
MVSLRGRELYDWDAVLKAEELNQESIVLKIVPSFDSKFVPKNATKLPDSQKIIKYTSEIETALKELMLISTSGNFNENVEVHFSYKKKAEILVKAGNMLLNMTFPFLKWISRLENSFFSVMIC